VNCELLSSSLGEVKDLSACGMRVRGRGWRAPQPGERLSVTLEFLRTRLTLQSRLVWQRKVGFLRNELGLEFEDVSPVAAVGVARIAQLARCSRTIHREALRY
jgi:hypothetical protein